MPTQTMLILIALCLTGADKPSEEAVKKEMDRFQGTWQLVSAESDGKKLPDEQAKKIQVVIKGNKHTVSFDGKAIAKEIPFKIDPTTTPKSVEDQLPDGGVIRGIYELDGDTLKSCVAAVGKDRPKEFTGKAGSGQTLRVFKRVKS